MSKYNIPDKRNVCQSCRILDKEGKMYESTWKCPKCKETEGVPEVAGAGDIITVTRGSNGKIKYT